MRRGGIAFKEGVSQGQPWALGHQWQCWPRAPFSVSRHLPYLSAASNFCHRPVSFTLQLQSRDLPMWLIGLENTWLGHMSPLVQRYWNIHLEIWILLNHSYASCAVDDIIVRDPHVSHLGHCEAENLQSPSWAPVPLCGIRLLHASFSLYPQ